MDLSWDIQKSVEGYQRRDSRRLGSDTAAGSEKCSGICDHVLARKFARALWLFPPRPSSPSRTVRVRVSGLGLSFHGSPLPDPEGLPLGTFIRDIGAQGLLRFVHEDVVSVTGGLFPDICPPALRFQMWTISMARRNGRGPSSSLISESMGVRVCRSLTDTHPRVGHISPALRIMDHEEARTTTGLATGHNMRIHQELGVYRKYPTMPSEHRKGRVGSLSA